MSDFVNFNELVDSIVIEKDYGANRPVVEKELLHYDILYALSATGLLKHITFQGGTSLRLCYGSNRFSEDLDFAGGRDFCSAQLLEIKACIEKYVGERYGLEVVVKEPKELRKERKSIGMIFQHFNLMENRTIFDNVDFSLKYTGKSKQERRQKVSELLELVGLEEKTSAYPNQLSGGQKQRVAIARALANEPKVLLCDEATSALDPKTTHQILALLKELNRKLGLTIVLITHEMQVVKEVCNKVAVMEDGKIVEKGSSVQIFSHPQEALTKDFIRTATHLDQALETIIGHRAFAEQITNKWLVELSYVGNQTNEPLIAQLYSKYQVTANILYGNVELL